MTEAPDHPLLSPSPHVDHTTHGVLGVLVCWVSSLYSQCTIVRAPRPRPLRVDWLPRTLTCQALRWRHNSGAPSASLLPRIFPQSFFTALSMLQVHRWYTALG